MITGSGSYQGNTYTIFIDTETNLTTILFFQVWNIESEVGQGKINKALRIWHYLFPEHEIQNLIYICDYNLIKGISILGEED